MKSLDEEINQLFDYLEKWRKLPKYQLERRLDIFFAIYLKEIIQGILKEKLLDCIIPEFPIQKSKFPIPKNNKSKEEKKTLHSFNIDYVMFTEDMKLLLIELKTDMRSKGDRQEKRMLEVKKQLDEGTVSLKKLIKHIEDIREGSEQKEKYDELLDTLNKEELRGHREAERNGAEVVYIQPLSEDRHKVIGFDEIVKELKKSSHGQTVLLDRFTKILSQISDTNNK